MRLQTKQYFVSDFKMTNYLKFRIQTIHILKSCASLIHPEHYLMQILLLMNAVRIEWNIFHSLVKKKTGVISILVSTLMWISIRVHM